MLVSALVLAAQTPDYIGGNFVSVGAGNFTGNGVGLSGLTNINPSALISTNVGSVGQTFNYLNSNTGYWATASGASSGGVTFDNIHNPVLLFDDFLSKPGTATPTPMGFMLVANSGAINQPAGETNAPGILNLQTSTSASAAPMLTLATDQYPISFHNGVFTNEWRFRLSALPSLGGGTNTYGLRIGYGNTINAAEPSDAIYITHNTNNANFVLVCRKDSGETRATNTTAVVAGAWYVGRITASYSTNVTMTINGGDSVTITNNIPTAGDVVSTMAQIIKSNGTFNVNLQLDYCKLGYYLGNRP